MKRLKTAGSIAAMALILCSCAAGNATTNAQADEPRTARTPPPTRSIDHPTGATEGEARGSVSGDMTATPTPEKQQQRGNTPPGKDREGQGPASGAIVDPSGAATVPKTF